MSIFNGLRFSISWFLLCSALAVLLISPAILSAQVATATLQGIVTDPSGAAVPGVKVTVTNTNTNISRVTETDATGSYTVPSLQPGNYTIEAQQDGFQTSILSGIVLQVAQQARMNIELQLGQLTETVNVEAAAPLIESENPAIGGVIEERRVVTLPLNGRNFMELTTLTAGINEGAGSTAKSFISKGYAPSAAGNPGAENNYTLDGADNKEGFFNTFALAPSVDAVQEFKIQVGQYAAEYGAGGGAVINVVTKSGTNEFHGTLFEFLRNDNFDARNFFLSPNDKIAPLTRNQFGGSAGGPIVRNRVFIFGNVDVTRERRGLFRTGSAPTNAERGGDLSGFGKDIIDIDTGLPYNNAIIPASLLDPIAQNLVQFYPQPNNPNPLANFVSSPSAVDDQENYLVRVDNQISDKHNLFSRYGIQDRFLNSPGTFPGFGGRLEPQRFQGVVLSLTSSISPTFLNEARFNFGRTFSPRKGQNTGTPIAADAGLPYGRRDEFGSGFPESIGLSQTTISGMSEGQPWFLTVNQYQWWDGVTWIRGGHTIKAGADIKRVNPTTELASHANGNYTFTGQYSGDGYADFLRGHVGRSLTAIAPDLPSHYSRTLMAYWLQDDWKITPTLTMNLGVRYEFNEIPPERDGRTPIFDQSLGGGAGGLRFPSHNTEAVPWFETNRPDLPVGKLDRKARFKSDKNNLGPRVGLAWRPFGTTETVLRAGYGWYYSQTETLDLINDSTTGPPARLWPTYVGSLDTPDLTWVGRVGTDPAQALREATFGVLTGPEEQWLDGYTQQWSFSLGQTLGKDYVVEAQYLGSKSTHINNSYDYNFAAPSPEPLAPRLPHPQWGRVFGFSSGSTATYNALMLSAEKRYTEGFAFKTGYTFAKALTGRGGRQISGHIALPQNPNNLAAENGHSADDLSHRLVASYIYELPFGRNKRFGSGWSGAADKILGGWAIAGISSFQSGFWQFTWISQQNCNSSFFNRCYPDLIGNPHLDSNGVDSPKFDVNAYDWPLNTAKHPAQDPRFGNAAPNHLQGNGVINTDLSLIKNTMIGERLRLEFRWETFNTFNHASFANPNNTPTSPSFGRTFSTQRDPRVNQFGLKLYW